MNLQRHDDVVAHMLQLQKVFPLSVPMACNNICLSHEVCLLAHEGFWVCTLVHRSYASLEPSLQMEATLENTGLLKR